MSIIEISEHLAAVCSFEKVGALLHIPLSEMTNQNFHDIELDRTNNDIIVLKTNS